MRKYERKIKQTPELDPDVALLFEVMRERDLTITDLVRLTGDKMHIHTVHRWKDGRQPLHSNLRLCFDALGYEFEVVLK
jgi:hypothetical protein